MMPQANFSTTTSTAQRIASPAFEGEADGRRSSGRTLCPVCMPSSSNEPPAAREVTGGLTWAQLEAIAEIGERGAAGLPACHDPAGVQLHWITLEAVARSTIACQDSAFESRRVTETRSATSRPRRAPALHQGAVRRAAYDSRSTTPSFHAQHHAAAEKFKRFPAAPDDEAQGVRTTWRLREADENGARGFRVLAGRRSGPISVSRARLRDSSDATDVLGYAEAVVRIQTARRATRPATGAAKFSCSAWVGALPRRWSRRSS